MDARIRTEFCTNGMHVMEGASLLGEGSGPISGILPQCGEGMDPKSFKVVTNYVAMPLSEAFRIEYWAMEEAKIRRQPAEKELSRSILVVVGGGSGIGREVALLAAARGAHVMIADRDTTAAGKVADELEKISSKESVASTGVDIRSRDPIGNALKDTVAAVCGVDILINTAAMLPSFPDRTISCAVVARTLPLNV